MGSRTMLRIKPSKEATVPQMERMALNLSKHLGKSVSVETEVWYYTHTQEWDRTYSIYIDFGNLHKVKTWQELWETYQYLMKKGGTNGAKSNRVNRPVSFRQDQSR